MEKVEKKGKETKEKKWTRKLELPSIMGNPKKEVAFDDDILASPRDVFGVPVSGTDSDSTGSSNYNGLGSPGVVSNRCLRDPQNQQWKTMIDVLRFKSVRRFSTIPLLGASYEISRRSLRNKLARIRPANDEDDLDSCIDIDGIATKPSWRNFNYADLVAATDDFNPGMNQSQIMHPFFVFTFQFMHVLSAQFKGYLIIYGIYGCVFIELVKKCLKIFWLN